MSAVGGVERCIALLVERKGGWKIIISTQRKIIRREIMYYLGSFSDGLCSVCDIKPQQDCAKFYSCSKY